VEGLVAVTSDSLREDRLVSNPLLTPAEASQQLGLSPGALAQLRYTGGGPCFIKLTAKAVRYRQSDLDAWIAAKARTSTRDLGVAR
jgi:predicted DNA-binding transcriptional regulator AlpA